MVDGYGYSKDGMSKKHKDKMYLRCRAANSKISNCKGRAILNLKTNELFVTMPYHQCDIITEDHFK